MGLKWFEPTSVRSRNPKRQWQMGKWSIAQILAEWKRHVFSRLVRCLTWDWIWLVCIQPGLIPFDIARSHSEGEIKHSMTEIHMPKINTNDKCTWVGLNMVLFFYFHIVSGNCTLLINSYPISYPLVPPLNSQCGWGLETSNLWTNPNSKFYLNWWSHHIPRYSYRITPMCLLLC